MSQTKNEKFEALKSLLPLLQLHLTFLEFAMKQRRYAASEGEPPEPPPVWLDLDCNGVCPGCEWENDCKGDRWEFAWHQLSRKHRLNTIAGALARLDIASPELARAVYAHYVEPYDVKTEPVREYDRKARERWADAGVRWMTRKIKGDITPLWERPKTTAEKVGQLLDMGVRNSVRIAEIVGCSDRRARQLRAVWESTHSVNVSATS